MKKLISVIAILFHLGPIFAQLNTTLLGHLSYNQPINDVWGFEKNGKKYAFVGVYNGVSIVDISDATNPVELFFIERDTSTWKDIKTFQNYAYVVSNENGSGLLVIDLTNLPHSIDHQYLTFQPFLFLNTDNLQVSDGFLYAFASNVFLTRTSIIFDLNNDPYNPELLGMYNQSYLHDGFVRDNKIYAAELHQGNVHVIDITDKESPARTGIQFSTPHEFTHNVWLSAENNILYTTDEVSNGTVSSYDISDLNNVQLLDSYTSEFGNGSVPNHVQEHLNYLIVSYYRDGLKIIDAHEPDNLVEVGYFDTSPFESGDGLEGNSGAFSFSSDQTIITTDREEGLFIIQPNFTRAGYFKGRILDPTGAGIPNATMTVQETKHTKQTNLTGNYTSGVPATGLYNLIIHQEGCKADTFKKVQLNSKATKIFNFTYDCVKVSTHIDALNTIDPLIYPLPFSQSLNIDLNTKFEYSIHSIDGIFSEQGNQSSAIGAQLPAGQYHIRITSPDGLYNGPIIKE